MGFLRRFQPYERGIPSHDTLCDIIAAIDPEMFKTCFLAWVEGLRDDLPDVIAIDGKTSRHSHARSKGRMPLHTVSAWATRQRLVLGQEAVAEKYNEINVIPLLIRRLDLNGALVTIDAMGTQAEIAQTTLDGRGDYILNLRENWPATHAAVQAAFAAASPALKFQRSETIDADHGRIETRRHTVCHGIGWLFSDRRYPGEFKFPGLAALGLIEREREHAGTVERETHYYLSAVLILTRHIHPADGGGFFQRPFMVRAGAVGRKPTSQADHPRTGTPDKSPLFANSGRIPDGSPVPAWRPARLFPRARKPYDRQRPTG